ncbi:PTS sugar transporter subunit IIC [Anaerosalibacter bizertensis]|uniref:PTS sugar transporter subunit IIC n=1 Tax=Anaerosalibacter bizertensis TaxID=932217 RepID=A0A844FG41_9FIRM|nr:PTS transporter subunit EIIC [Anaerosalibacter bizertensis]MBV1818803.1 PTS transporter subunit EIIC [Bacteroidales bacterium MSK.15.36]HHV26723.1 PTS transporter subunit EIIC [Tissierellia bacterium]MCB5559102.1 PTS transporter subunit EIIC [Anaerosalibacter bizertensis]MCG4565111.1 PTS transporter subunit EIIC [Anaerosalibacter bizertensis]MCG4581891.1 PTS transporter subunit EIIC [Anaerosalibacter bizertensis]
MSAKISNLGNEILQNIGGEENIISFENCMTRLRISLKDDSLLNKAKLEKVEGVMGVVKSGQEVQVIVGPGTASKVSNYVKENTSIKVTDNPEFGQADEMKKQVKEQYKAPGSGFLNKIAQIFIPLIPAFIGSGLIMGINNILNTQGLASENVIGLLGAFSGAVFGYMAIMVGMNAARVFGASTAIGGLMGGITISPVLEGVELFGRQLVPGRGGIISVILVVWFASVIEKKLRKSLPSVLELILTPLLTILISGFAAVLILQPIGGAISDGIGVAVSGAIEKGGAFTGAILGGTFLPLVMTGLHQGLTPIHADLLDTTGVTTLLPILAMAGAGQVGASFAVLARTKNKRLKQTIGSALPVGILGIGEPLIYGVTLPLGKPFLGACIGGAVGGAIVAPAKVGAMGMGISGLPLALLIAPGGVGRFILGIIGAYVGGFIATLILGFDDPVEE